MKLEVKITKEIYEQSVLCGTANFKGRATENCAVALAVREIFPEAAIGSYTYCPFKESVRDQKGARVHARHSGARLIDKFDKLSDNPKKRLELPETTVTLEITDEILEHMPMEWENIIEKSELLELVD